MSESSAKPSTLPQAQVPKGSEEAFPGARSPGPAHTVLQHSTGATATSESDSMAFVMDVPIELSVEIGRKSLTIAEVVRLSAGSVVELDSAAGEPLTIYVNKRPIARGEAVVVGEHYGVRIVEILLDDRQRREGQS